MPVMGADAPQTRRTERRPVQCPKNAAHAARATARASNTSRTSATACRLALPNVGESRSVRG
jgi:hypothetical protein